MSTYATPRDGLPGQTELHTGRAIFTESYAVIPRGVMSSTLARFVAGVRRMHGASS